MKTEFKKTDLRILTDAELEAMQVLLMEEITSRQSKSKHVNTSFESEPPKFKITC